MKYMDGELYRLIENFKEFGDFNSNREAQNALAQSVQRLPFYLLLQPEQVENEKPFDKIPDWNGGPGLG
jgi:hypothetical protein